MCRRRLVAVGGELRRPSPVLQFLPSLIEFISHLER
jgi:hypothetical protein